jgi:Flp pilus assembly protein TadD
MHNAAFPIPARRDRAARLPMLLATLVLVTAGCAGRPPATDAVATITTAQLLAGETFAAAANGDEIVDAAEILSVNAQMRAFIGEYVDPADTRYLKLQQLLRAVITDGSFGLAYDDSTRTAAGTFSARSGNCLSFTNMFIAMAREVGLDVSYQEVDVPPDWTMRGDTYVMSRHVNVKVQLRSDVEHVVDFNIDDFKSSYERTEISDERAFAHFFSNKGVERMQERDHGNAFRYFRAALEFDPEFAPAWINLAALYNRAGKADYAEAAYHEALRLQPNDLLAMSNLARLYQAAGNDELAASYRERVHYHRHRNPYYRYALARQAFLERDYDASIEHLEFAVSKKRWEDSFYFLMGLSYLQLGDEDEARKWLEKAEEVAESDALKRNYQSKLDLLLD